MAIKVRRATKSKIATTLKRKATPKRRPARRNPKSEIRNPKFNKDILYVFLLIIREFLSKIKNAANKMGSNIKFSALAIFPSIRGSPRRIVKTIVAKI